MDISVYGKGKSLKENYWWFVGKNKILRSLLEDFLPPKKLTILEVGCGGSTSLPVLKELGKVTGIDSNPLAIELCRGEGYCRLEVGDGTALKFSGKTFDLVALFDLLEHVKDDQKALIEACRVLKEGGWVAITVPAFPFLWSGNDVINHHHRRYWKKELLNKVRKAGFSVKKISYYNTFLFPVFLVWFIAKKIVSCFSKSTSVSATMEVKLPKIVNRFFSFLFSSEALFLKNFDFPWGLSLVCLARKGK